MKPFLFFLFCITTAFSSFAQERDFMREGNRLYKEKKYDSAAITYLAAAATKADYAAAWFNLGNAEAQQKKHKQAAEAYNTAIANTQDKALKASAYYGLGSNFAAQNQWKEAVQAYKQSLRLMPGDADTKYNYSYALSKLKQQQEQQQQQQNNQQQKKNDPPPQNNPPQKKDPPPQNKNGEQQQKEEQQKKSKLSKEQADNILNALQQDEQKLHRDQNKGQPVQAGSSGKDW